MEVVIDFEFLRGRTNKIIVKELSIATANVSDSFRFKSPYPMTPHGSVENGLNWDDGHIAYSELYTVASEAVAVFDNLYSYGVAKCAFLTELMSRPILNQQVFNCTLSKSFNHKYWCSMSCHKFPHVNCATKTTHSLYDWLMCHLQTKFYVQCPKEMTRHTAKFVSAI